MRIDSAGNVGIGTTTPGSTLDVNGTVRFEDLTNCDTIDTDSDGVLSCGTDGGGSSSLTDGYIFVGGNDGVAQATSSIYIADSGDVGIGITSPFTKLDVLGTGTGAAVASSGSSDATTNFRVGRGTVGVDIGTLDNGTSYLQNRNISNFATNYDFVLQPNGGDVGIGTTNPTGKLTISGAGTTNIDYTNGDSLGAALVVSDTGASQVNGGQILFGANQGLFAGIKAELRSGSGPAGNLNFQTRNTSGNILTRMTVNYQGNVGIGDTAPASKLSVKGASGSTSNLFTVASSTGTSLFDVDYDGLTTIGDPTATGDAAMQFSADDTAWSIGYYSGDGSFRIASSTNLVAEVALSIAKGGNTTIYGSAVTCTIGNGTSATSCSSSDERLKENIAELSVASTSSLELIRALNPVSYDWNEWMRENGAASTTQYGFIAQEVMNVLPSLVTMDANTGYYKLDYQGFFAPMAGAIQELDMNLEAILASSTATSTTPQSKAFAERFFGRMTEWFADKKNEIGDFFANRVRTKQLCIGDENGSETCITKAELDNLLTGQGQSATVNNSNTGNTGNTGSTGTTTDDGNTGGGDGGGTTATSTDNGTADNSNATSTDTVVDTDTSNNDNATTTDTGAGENDSDTSTDDSDNITDTTNTNSEDSTDDTDSSESETTDTSGTDSSGSDSTADSGESNTEDTGSV